MDDSDGPARVDGGYGQQILNSLTSGVIVVDRDGRIVIANRAAARHLHADTRLLNAGAALAELPPASPLMTVFDEIAATGETINRRELRLPAANEQPVRLGLSASPLEGPAPFNGVIFLFTDMTERQAMEHAAELNRQLAALGELTAGIVHELRNPVGVISGMAELLLRRLGEDRGMRDAVQTILDEAAGLERSISLFLGFARPYDVERAPCEARDVAQRSIQLCARRAGKKSVDLRLTVADNLPQLIADPNRLAQAVANILNNAIDAVDTGGTVELRVCVKGSDMAFDILDDGPGVLPDDDLFKPFFTRKEGGTGLGLSIVHRIVSAHGGRVDYGNREDGGAWFTIRVPLET